MAVPFGLSSTYTGTINKSIGETLVKRNAQRAAGVFIWLIFWPAWIFFAALFGLACLGILAINNLDDWRHAQWKNKKATRS